MSLRVLSDRARRRSSLPIAFAIGVGLTAGACSDSPGPTEPRFSPAAATTSLSQVSQEEEPDQMAVAQAVPGFGGYFLDESGAPAVYLTDPSRREEAEAALATFLSSRGFTASDLRVRQGEYDYLQLDAWYQRVLPQALSVSGAVFADLDEGANRLRFGGLDAGALAAIAAAVAQAGVPAAATVVEQSEPIQQVVTLRDRVRPVPGGYQINFFAIPSPLTLVCTLGFNVVKNAVNSFITNSHCTNEQGGTVPQTDYYQPTRGAVGNPANFIGKEVEDPDYSFEKCLEVLLPGFRCRYSDAARAEYDAPVPFELGRIARTVERRNDPAFEGATPNLNVDATNPTFRINSESKRSVLGEEANKVGRTTGWTFGPVIQTCITTIVAGTNIVQLCQDRVQAGVAGGDSGSPVFRWHGVGGNIRLMGILWGSSTRNGRTTFVFSPMHGIHRELGDFRTQ